MKVEVATLTYPSLISLMVSVDIKHHVYFVDVMQHRLNRARELCESRGGRPGLPVPNSPYGLCGRKATLNLNSTPLLRSFPNVAFEIVSVFV